MANRMSDTNSSGDVEIFESEFLNNDQIQAGYEDALRQIEVQRLQNHMQLRTSPNDASLRNNKTRLERSLRDVKSDYDAWKKKNDISSPEKTETQSGTRTLPQGPI